MADLMNASHGIGDQVARLSNRPRGVPTALAGLIPRITSLRLEVVEVHLVAPPPPGQ
jgi:hypothetical protein